MPLQYETYPFTPILGWSLSRYETFDKCKRQYYYTYYHRFVKDVPHYKLRRLRELTSTALEIGNIIHDLMEAFLHRLRKDTGAIDTDRFRAFAYTKAEEYFATKTCIETYYDGKPVNMEEVRQRLTRCIDNFLDSPCFSWIFMKAITNKDDWMIEPPGFGETRINGLKAYCKMDFLFPVDGEIHILDWKTGKRDEVKHFRQLTGYAVAASNNFGLPLNRIYSRIVYLNPVFDELESVLKPSDVDSFIELVGSQTRRMYTHCKDVEQNIPLDIDAFPQSPSRGICGMCNYRELCFPQGFAHRTDCTL